MLLTTPKDTEIQFFAGGIHENKSIEEITSIINFLNIGDVISVVKHTNIYNHTDAPRTGTYVFLKNTNLKNAVIIEQMFNKRFYINNLSCKWACSIHKNNNVIYDNGTLIPK